MKRMINVYDFDEQWMRLEEDELEDYYYYEHVDSQIFRIITRMRVERALDLKDKAMFKRYASLLKTMNRS